MTDCGPQKNGMDQSSRGDPPSPFTVDREPLRLPLGHRRLFLLLNPEGLIREHIGLTLLYYKR
jgi:hypothetical protein